MGYPVNSISMFEDRIQRIRKGYVLIVFANAESDSRAVEYVLNNFHEMDTISAEVSFYLPGYGAIPSSSGESSKLKELSALYDDSHVSTRVWSRKLQRVLNLLNTRLYPRALERNPALTKDAYIGTIDLIEVAEDFGLELSEEEAAIVKDCFLGNGTEQLGFIRRIDSPRLGPLYFNLAEYVDFVMEFTRRKPGYFFMGNCEMNLVPVNDGKPDYRNSHTYDLDAIVGSPNGISLDYFFHFVFKTIKGFIYHDDHRSFLGRLFGKDERIVSEIDDFYQKAVRRGDLMIIQEQNALTLKDNMERYLRWGLDEEFFFISYSTRNILKAEMLKSALESFGKHVWMAPDGIPQGCNYAAVIPTALKFAKHFVLLLTPDSAQSHWVKRELDIAINNEDNMRVKVLLADDFDIVDIRRDPELHFYLNKVQIKYRYDDVIRDPNCLRQFVFE